MTMTAAWTTRPASALKLFASARLDDEGPEWDEEEEEGRDAPEEVDDGPEIVIEDATEEELSEDAKFDISMLLLLLPPPPFKPTPFDWELPPPPALEPLEPEREPFSSAILATE